MNTLKRVWVVVIVIAAAVCMASAEIVVSGVLNLNPPNVSDSNLIPPPDGYNIDFNQDGVLDFSVFQVDRRFGTDAFRALNGTEYAGYDMAPQAWRFRLGDVIDSNRFWHGSDYRGVAPFFDPPIIPPPSSLPSYIGFRMPVEDDLLYGWIRIADPGSYASFTLHSWAYETVPNTPIVAGDIGTPAAIPESAAAGWVAIIAISALALGRLYRRRSHS